MSRVEHCPASTKTKVALYHVVVAPLILFYYEPLSFLCELVVTRYSCRFHYPLFALENNIGSIFLSELLSRRR